MTSPIRIRTALVMAPSGLGPSSLVMTDLDGFQHTFALDDASLGMLCLTSKTAIDMRIAAQGSDEDVERNPKLIYIHGDERDEK